LKARIPARSATARPLLFVLIGLSLASGWMGLQRAQAAAIRPPAAAAPPESFGQVRIVAQPYLPQRVVELGLASDQQLQAQAARALDLLYDRRPETRKRALETLKDVATVIPLAQAAPVLEWVRQTDPQREAKPDEQRPAFPIREQAADVLARVQQRLNLEQWLSGQPPDRRAAMVVGVLSNRGPRWRYTGQPADDDTLVMWLVRHPAESAPILLRMQSGQAFASGSGAAPKILTTNRAARIAAAMVIGVHRVRAGIPYLVSLLQDPTCIVAPAAGGAAAGQNAPPGAGKGAASGNLVRSYPLRDAAAGALQRLGYAVKFDGKQYQASAPATAGPAPAEPLQR
jgi:hypothetical protein